MKLFQALLLGLVIPAFSCEKEEPDSIAYGSLHGIVTNDYGQPIKDAIIDIGYDTKYLTDVDGSYSVEKLQAKEYTVAASMANYITKVQSVTVLSENIVTLNFTLAAGISFMDISDTAVQVNPVSGRFKINVTSNAGWTVSTPSSWLLLSKTNGEGNSEVEVSYTESKEFYDRSDTVSFISGTIVKRLIVKQECPIKLTKYEVILGNLVTGVSDSVYFYFNKPVSVESLKDNCQDCGCPLQYDHTGYRANVSISYGCIKLLGYHPFHFTVKDQYGNQLVSSIDVNVYKSKLHLDGSITDYVLINDDKEVLLAAYNPSRLIRYSIEEDRILQEYDFSEYIAPLRIFKNSYNSKVYIVGTDPKTDIALPVVDLPYLYSLNPNTGEVKREITFVADSLDHPDYPTVLPFCMGFTKTGLGIVCLKSGNGGMIYRWKMLDTSKSDSIYEYPYYDQYIEKTFLWKVIAPNFDNSKLILVHFYGLSKYGIFDSSTGRITLVEPAPFSSASYVIPNRLTDKVYVAQSLEQFIMDLNGNITSNGISQLSAVDGLSADFSYRHGEEDIIYGWDWFYFRILDYKNMITIMSIKTPYKTGNIKSTIDGKYILALKFNDVYATDLYVIETQSLYQNVK